MHKAQSRQMLYDHMRQLMATDKARHTILPLTKFGLMQITRQRIRPVAVKDIKEVCPTCGGTGKTIPSVLIDKQIENQIAYYAIEKRMRSLRIVVNPIMAAYLTKGGLCSIRRKWCRRYLCRIKLLVDQSMGIIEFKLVDKKRKELS